MSQVRLKALYNGLGRCPFIDRAQLDIIRGSEELTRATILKFPAGWKSVRLMGREALWERTASGVCVVEISESMTRLGPLMTLAKEKQAAESFAMPKHHPTSLIMQYAICIPQPWRLLSSMKISFVLCRSTRGGELVIIQNGKQFNC